MPVTGTTPSGDTSNKAVETAKPYGPEDAIPFTLAGATIDETPAFSIINPEETTRFSYNTLPRADLFKPKADDGESVGDEDSTQIIIINNPKGFFGVTVFNLMTKYGLAYDPEDPFSRYIAIPADQFDAIIQSLLRHIPTGDLDTPFPMPTLRRIPQPRSERTVPQGYRRIGPAREESSTLRQTQNFHMRLIPVELPDVLGGGTMYRLVAREFFPNGKTRDFGYELWPDSSPAIAYHQAESRRWKNPPLTEFDDDVANDVATEFAPFAEVSFALLKIEALSLPVTLGTASIQEAHYSLNPNTGFWELVIQASFRRKNILGKYNGTIVRETLARLDIHSIEDLRQASMPMYPDEEGNPQTYLDQSGMKIPRTILPIFLPVDTEVTVLRTTEANQGDLHLLLRDAEERQHLLIIPADRREKFLEVAGATAANLSQAQLTLRKNHIMQGENLYIPAWAEEGVYNGDNPNFKGFSYNLSYLAERLSFALNCEIAPELLEDPNTAEAVSSFLDADMSAEEIRSQLQERGFPLPETLAHQEAPVAETRPNDAAAIAALASTSAPTGVVVK